MAADIRPHLDGSRITSARVHKPDLLRRITRPAFEKGLRGRTVTAVGRRAKHLTIILDDGRRVVVQPRMTGSFLVLRGPASDPYAGFDLRLAGGAIVRYRDVRRLGAVFLLSPRQWAAYDAAIGPEPLEAAFTPDVLAGILRGGRLAVKKAIMDQRRLAGVGNIYANEALWIAGIDPSREARRVRGPEIVPLHAAIVDVLRRSVEGRGTTVRDYRTGTGEPGTFQGRLAVYGRDREPCLRCGRRIVLTHAIDARATYLCPGCQR